MSKVRPPKTEPKPHPKPTEKVVIKLLCTPTGKYNLANAYGDNVELSPELTKRILDAGDGEIVK